MSLCEHVHVSVCAHARAHQEQAGSSKGFLVLWKGPSSDFPSPPLLMDSTASGHVNTGFSVLSAGGGEGESAVRRKPGCSVDSNGGRVEGDPHQSTWHQGEDRWGQNTSSLALERGEWGKDTHGGGGITKGFGK